jgi:hypothetical protein
MESVKMISFKAKEVVPFHFLLLAIGEVLKINDYVTPQKLQDYIQSDDTFGVRPPLDDCRLALELMEHSNFIIKDYRDEYIWQNHPDKHSDE